MLDTNKIKFSEFMNPALDINNRTAASFSDELVIRKAKIYKCLGPTDDRLQVQIFPELQGIPDSEMDDLPKYPAFFKGEVITGKSIKDDGEEAEFVWCMCTPDLQVGYILGKSNIFGDPSKKYVDSYSWSDVRSFIQERNLVIEDFDYKHLHVLNFVISDEGGFINVYNYLTGDYILLNTSGSIFSLQQKQIFMRVGTPASPKQGRTAFSSITITDNNITLETPNLHLHGDQIKLGKAPSLKVLGCPGGVLLGKNGVSASAVSSVSI